MTFCFLINIQILRLILLIENIILILVMSDEFCVSKIMSDGKIILIVHEGNNSWCSYWDRNSKHIEKQECNPVGCVLADAVVGMSAREVYA